MTFGITAVSIIVIVILVHTLEMRSFHKRLRMKFRQEYGQKPDMDKPLSDDKERALYYNLIKNRIPDDEKLDEVTWEDLEMTQIFRRVNTTVSYAGEQLLFAWLHRLPKDKTSLERREKMIRYFDTHPKEREDTQLLLYHLKKEAIHYYVPEFVEQLQYQQMPFLLLCKLLLCSLLFFIIASVLTANSSVATIAGSHFVFNIVVYCMLMVASHDLELAETLKESYDNYHFRESVQEGDVLFDYKLHSGISYTRNAVRLLEAMGFPEEIVSNASKYSS